MTSSLANGNLVWHKKYKKIKTGIFSFHPQKKTDRLDYKKTLSLTEMDKEFRKGKKIGKEKNFSLFFIQTLHLKFS